MINRFFLILISTAVFSIMNGQQCSYTVKGEITHTEEHEKHIENCSVCLKESEKESKCCISNDKGEFCLKNLCEGEYEIEFSHLGKETHTEKIYVKNDTVINVNLKYKNNSLKETIVSGEIDQNTQAVEIVNREEIINSSNKTIGDILSSVTGVSSLKNGGGVSKPIIHGLTGNRVGYVVDNASLTSQQWGNDHAPEIDPFTSEDIEVVKGVSVLEYNAPSSNALVIFKPKKYNKDRKLHGGFHLSLIHI